jgi:quercetin dioxygenase-like cupin family protein
MPIKYAARKRREISHSIPGRAGKFEEENMELSVQRWDQPNKPSESELMDKYRQEGLQPYAWSNGPGDVYAPHSHSYHKVIYVVHGSITWLLPDQGEEITTKAGDRIDLPSGVLHAARVGPDGVTCLEAHRDS